MKETDKVNEAGSHSVTSFMRLFFYLNADMQCEYQTQTDSVHSFQSVLGTMSNMLCQTIQAKS